ncbi:MAG: hypothetical protein ACOZNI_30965 [Myxococcota bacterium]
MLDSPVVARVTLGLAAALLLAVVAAHPRVRAWEERLGITVMFTSGLPFLLLGAFLAAGPVGVLSPAILGDLKPALEFGLGWMGFVVGTQLDVRRLDRLPAPASTLLGAQTFFPAALTAGVCAPLLLLLGAGPGDGLVRDVLLLAGCAVATAPVAVRLSGESSAALDEVAAVDAVAALASLGAVSIFLRPDALQTNWALPGSALLVLMLGLGAMLGVLAWLVLRAARDETEEAALLIGLVALSAGLAAYLALSGAVVCALAGAVLANLPLPDRRNFLKLLHEVERPLYLVFLVIVGATWRPFEVAGWLLAAAYVVGRVGGKWLATRVATRLEPSLPHPVSLARALVPQGPVAILVMAAAATLYGETAPRAVGWAVHAAIVGALATDVLARALRPHPPTRLAA